VVSLTCPQARRAGDAKLEISTTKSTIIRLVGGDAPGLRRPAKEYDFVSLRLFNPIRSEARNAE
jgi:hypothetical protein